MESYGWVHGVGGHDSRGRGHGFWGHGIEGHYIVRGYRVWVMDRGSPRGIHELGVTG